ncbi:MAG: hypothetical protein V1913_09410 [Fibrobacterota bacterium]
MLFDPLKPFPQGHNPRALRAGLLPVAALLLHFLLLQSEFVRLGTRLLSEGPWPGLVPYLRWLQGNANFWPLVLSAAVFLGLTLFLQIACGLVDQLLDWVFERRHRTFVLLCAVLSVFLSFYIAPGSIAESGDASAHLMHVWLAGESLRHGELPVWSNWLYCGSPFLQDYGPLFFYLAGAAFALLRDLSLSAKLVLFLLHLASGLTFFHMVATVLRDKRIALFGALAYALIGWHSHYILIMGRYPVAPLYALLPLLFLEAHRLLETPGRTLREETPAMVRLSLYGSLAFLCHFIYPAQFLLFLGVYVLARIVLRYRAVPSVPEGIHTLKKFALAAGGGAVLAAGALIPFVLERSYTMAGANMALTDPLGEAGRTFNIAAWFVWNNDHCLLFNYGSPQWGDAYFGLTLFLALPVALLLKAFRRRESLYSDTLKGAAAALVAFFLLVAAWNIVGKVPLLRSLYITACERYQLALAFFLPLFACAFLSDLKGAVWGTKGKARLLALMPFLLALLLLDLGPLSLQAPFAPRDDWDKHAAMTVAFEKEYRASNGAVPAARLYYEGISSYDFELKGAPMAVRRAYHPSVLGSFSQGAPLSYLYLKEFYPQFQDQIEKRPDILLDKRLLNLFFLTNTPLLVLNGEKNAPGNPIIKKRTLFGREKTVLELAFGSPIVYSGNIAAFESSGSPGTEGRWLLDRYNIDYATGSADTLFVQGAELPALSPSAIRPIVTVSAFSQTHRTANLTLTASQPVYVRLPYSWHPGLRVMLNGSAVNVSRADMNFICITVPAGESRIRLEGGLTRLRTAFWILSGLGFMVAIGFLIVHRKKDTHA